MRAAQFVRLLRQMSPNLFKWHLASLVMYDAILYADTDVDLLPVQTAWDAAASAHVRDQWAQTLPQLVRDPSVRLVGSADWSSPINGGILLFLPSASLYEEGVRLLATAPFDVNRGWNYTGSPVQLLGPSARLRHVDNSTLMHAGRRALIDDLAWTFVAADIDQGFLVYMTLGRQSLMRYAHHGAHRHVADHFFGKGKPYRAVLAYAEQHGAHAANRSVPPARLCEVSRWVRDAVLDEGIDHGLHDDTTSARLPSTHLPSAAGSSATTHHAMNQVTSATLRPSCRWYYRQALREMTEELVRLQAAPEPSSRASLAARECFRCTRPPVTASELTRQCTRSGVL